MMIYRPELTRWKDITKSSFPVPGKMIFPLQTGSLRIKIFTFMQ